MYSAALRLDSVKLKGIKCILSCFNFNLTILLRGHDQRLSLISSALVLIITWWIMNTSFFHCLQCCGLVFVFPGETIVSVLPLCDNGAICTMKKGWFWLLWVIWSRSNPWSPFVPAVMCLNAPQQLWWTLCLEPLLTPSTPQCHFLPDPE